MQHKAAQRATADHLSKAIHMWLHAGLQLAVPGAAYAARIVQGSMACSGQHSIALGQQLSSHRIALHCISSSHIAQFMRLDEETDRLTEVQTWNSYTAAARVGRVTAR